MTRRQTTGPLGALPPNHPIRSPLFFLPLGGIIVGMILTGDWGNVSAALVLVVVVVAITWPPTGPAAERPKTWFIDWDEAPPVDVVYERPAPPTVVTVSEPEVIVEGEVVERIPRPPRTAIGGGR